MNNTVIRHAEAHDYKAIISTLAEWWGRRWMAQMLPKLFFVHFCPTSFVAEQDGLIVGFVVDFVSQSYPDEGYIHFVGVHPDFRKTVLGHQLYECVFEAMRRCGCGTVRCVTSPSNKGSIAFHLRLGFKSEISEKLAAASSMIQAISGEVQIPVSNP